MANYTNDNYLKYLKAYGAQGYADLIKQKEAAGQTLDDPTAAATFKTDYSSLFPSTSTGGSAASTLSGLRSGTIANAGNQNSGVNNLVGVRSYLTGQGYTNPEIGWSQADKTVTLNSKPLISPSTVTDGTSYSPLAALQAALKKYKSTDYGAKAAETLAQIKNPKAFSYDVSSDPQYTAAEQLMESELKRQNQSTLATMNERGIVNSNVTTNQLGENSRILGDRLAAIIPGLYQNALSQYNQENQNQYSLLNALTSLQSGQQSATTAAQTQQSETALNAYNQAMDRWKAAGTVSAQDEAILGVAAGTPTSDYSYKQAQTEIDQLNAQANITRANKTGSSGTDKTDYAQEFINNNAGYYANAKTMYDDVLSQIQRGVVDYDYGMKILSELKKMYPDQFSNNDILSTLKGSAE
jgi:hypothetical protein